MAHSRTRFALPFIQKLASFWHVVGVQGMRQVGKTTLMKHQLGIQNQVSFDDEQTRTDAENSAKVFLSKLSRPVVIDEVQKVPKIFDAIKGEVDEKRIPGNLFLTGSSRFALNEDIRESLTGRIANLHLFPMTLAEAHQKNFKPIKTIQLKENEKPRFSTQDFTKLMMTGGLPLPLFMRDTELRELYWKNWLETTILRDLVRVMKGKCDPDTAFSILDQFGRALKNGEHVTLASFAKPSKQKLTNYLIAMRSIFLIRRINCHEKGTGRSIYVLGDSGLAHHLMASETGTGVTLSLARHTFLNEVLSNFEYSGKRVQAQYFKSEKGTPVDLILQNIPFKLVELSEVSKGAWGWHEKALLGAMKKLNSKEGCLVAPVNEVVLSKRSTVGQKIWILPWSYFS